MLNSTKKRKTDNRKHGSYERWSENRYAYARVYQCQSVQLIEPSSHQVILRQKPFCYACASAHTPYDSEGNAASSSMLTAAAPFAKPRPRPRPPRPRPRSPRPRSPPLSPPRPPRLPRLGRSKRPSISMKTFSSFLVRALGADLV